MSVTYTEGEDAPVLIAHGTAELVDSPHPLFAGFDAFANEIYEPIAIEYGKAMYKDRTGPDFTGFVRPRRIYAQGFPKAT